MALTSTCLIGTMHSTHAQKRLAAFLVVFRCVNALALTTSFTPDEFWQGPEVAHRLVSRLRADTRHSLMNDMPCMGESSGPHLAGIRIRSSNMGMEDGYQVCVGLRTSSAESPV